MIFFRIVNAMAASVVCSLFLLAWLLQTRPVREWLHRSDVWADEMLNITLIGTMLVGAGSGVGAYWLWGQMIC